MINYFLSSTAQLPSGFLSLRAIIIGVTKSMGKEMAINNVCNCVNAIVKATPLTVPTNNERKLPAHVGHAINNPVAAPIELALFPFFEIENAVKAIAALRPTRYDTVTCRTRLIGIICNPM